MIELIKLANKQIKANNINVANYNKFFKEVNSFLKGDASTLIKVMLTPRSHLLISNILSDKMALLEVATFKLYFIEWLKAFYDNKELLYDLFVLMLDCNIIVLSHDIRLKLFALLYKSGFFCYVTNDSKEFKANYDYIAIDLKIISSIVSSGTIEQIEGDFIEVLKDLYLLEGYTLKDCLI